MGVKKGKGRGFRVELLEHEFSANAKLLQRRAFLFSWPRPSRRTLYIAPQLSRNWNIKLYIIVTPERVGKWLSNKQLSIRIRVSVLKYIRAWCWSSSCEQLSSSPAVQPALLLSFDGQRNLGTNFRRETFRLKISSILVAVTIESSKVEKGASIFVARLHLIPSSLHRWTFNSTQIIMRGKWYDLGLYNCNWFRPPFRGSCHKMRNGWNPNTLKLQIRHSRRFENQSISYHIYLYHRISP